MESNRGGQYLSSIKDYLNEWYTYHEKPMLITDNAVVSKGEDGEYYLHQSNNIINLEHLDTDDIVGLYALIHDNRHTLAEYVEEKEEGAVLGEDTWVVEPVEITNDGETLGAIAVSVMDIEGGREDGKTTLGVVYLSSDGGYSVITLWTKEEESEKEIAIGDLRATVSVLEEIITKLQSDELD